MVRSYASRLRLAARTEGLAPAVREQRRRNARRQRPDSICTAQLPPLATETDASASKAREHDMDAERAGREREFETLLLEVLTQDYDLPVRHSSDALERRRRGVASLG